MLTRLQKILADAGIASRRQAEQFILNGRVSVNGKVVTQLGSKADPELDDIAVNNSPIRINNEKVVLMLNKPPGYVCTTRTFKGERNVLALARGFGRIYPVGRLDKDTSGLLILTNDGDLAEKLMHPRYRKEKEYHVVVNRLVPAEFERAVTTGIKLTEGTTLPAHIAIESERSFYITLRQGMKRQIRLMCQQFGLKVLSLKRIRINNLELGGLAQGDCRKLTANEVKKLLK